jgi:uncharacterized membrane protein YgcG
MDNALTIWLSTEQAGIKQSKRAFCKRADIGVPYATFRNRLRKEVPFDVPVTGRPGLFKHSDCNAIVDAVACLDHLNNGKNDKQIAHWLVGRHTEYTYEQMRNAWRRTIKVSGDILGDYSAQPSDKQRSGAITEVSQRFYFALVDEAMAEARRLSAPDELPDGPLRTLWTQISANFVLNLDEANHQANTGSGKRTVGDRSKRKHETNDDDSRLSITGVECGNAAGVDGPSMYLYKGVGLPVYLENSLGNSGWLKRHGAPANSFCVPTPNAFMTNDTWDAVVERLALGIRAMPVIVDHPLFWVVLHLDGFKSHVMTEAGQKILYGHRILVVKENSHSSQVNQAFDQDPAILAKKENRRWLPIVRQHPGLVKSVDQYALIVIVMAGQAGGRGKAWTAGFIRVNLHPDHKIPMEVWLSNISERLVAAGGTERLLSDAYSAEAYLRLVKVPEFFRELVPAEQEELRQLTHKSVFDFGPDALRTLPLKYATQFKEKRNMYHFFQYRNSMDEAVRRGIALVEDIFPASALKRNRAQQAALPQVVLPQREQNKESMRDVGNYSYRITGKPGLPPQKQFEAACQFRARFAGKEAVPSSYLDLAFTPDQERVIFKISARDFSIGALLDTALDFNLGKGLAQRKINLLGELEGMACIVNTPERQRMLHQANQLGVSLAALKLSKREHAKKTHIERGVAKARKAAKNALESPIIALLTAAAVLPHGVGDKKPTNALNIAPMITYVKQMGFSLPKVTKPKARNNLVLFLSEYCTQQTRQVSSPPLEVARSSAATIEANFKVIVTAAKNRKSSKSEVEDDEQEDDEQSDVKTVKKTGTKRKRSEHKDDDEQEDDEPEDDEQEDDEPEDDEQEDDEPEDDEQGEEDEEEECEDAPTLFVVEAIMRTRGHGKSQRFLVRWEQPKTGGRYEDTWEPMESLQYCTQALQEYNDRISNSSSSNSSSSGSSGRSSSSNSSSSSSTNSSSSSSSSATESKTAINASTFNVARSNILNQGTRVRTLSATALGAAQSEGFEKMRKAQK